MTFISYAQNFEDVMLWRALKHVKQGFYIDIGAAWPDEHSVTMAFYERDWQGINVEPNSAFYAQLQERRPRDTNLRLAVGEREGILMMNYFANTGLSTFDDVIATKHQSEGRNVERLEVPVITLEKLWREHVAPSQPVHFLKIDVEGLEESILRGKDWTKNRPWIVVVEATLPLSQVESYANWEPILLAANYQFAYADGLNRFYVSNENAAALLPAFKYPPNVFDDFILSRTQQAEERAIKTEERATKAEALLADIHSSKSWQITAPLRWTIRQFRILQSKLR